MTETERILSMKNGTQAKEYATRVNQKIRARYSLSEELSILRKRDNAPEEFAASDLFAESCKQEARREIYGEEATA